MLAQFRLLSSSASTGSFASTATLLPGSVAALSVTPSSLSVDLEGFMEAIERLLFESFMLGQRTTGQRNPEAWSSPIQDDVGLTPRGIAMRILLAKLQLLYEVYQPAARTSPRQTR